MAVTAVSLTPKDYKISDAIACAHWSQQLDGLIEAIATGNWVCQNMS